MDSNAFLNDLMSKMKLPEAKGKKKAEQSESVAQILAAMQKVRAEKKKPPVTSYAPVKEMPVNEPESMEVPYGLEGTSSRIDEAYIQFQKVKQITLVLAEVDNSIYRLANAISKTQKRANALKNVVIPRYQSSIKEMTESLEEKEREEFSRMKVIKAQKEKTLGD